MKKLGFLRSRGKNMDKDLVLPPLTDFIKPELGEAPKPPQRKEKEKVRCKEIDDGLMWSIMQRRQQTYISAFFPPAVEINTDALRYDRRSRVLWIVIAAIVLCAIVVIA